MKMVKAVVVVMMVCFLASPAMARKATNDQHPIVVFGQVLESVTTIDQGGPLQGVFGTTRYTHTLIAQEPTGKLYALSSYGAQSDGLGKTFVNAVGGNTGPFNPLWPATQVSSGNVNVGSVGQVTGAVAGNFKNSNKNSNFQSQGQSQYQQQSQKQKAYGGAGGSGGGGGYIDINNSAVVGGNNSGINQNH